MAEKRYYWLRLYKDFFTSKRIKKLRSIAGGDTYTIIYLKMQLKALDTDGYLYFDGVMNDFADELALDLDENTDDVKVTINYLLSVGLLESNAQGERYKLSYMENVVGSETASTQRVREHRMRKALQCNTNVTEVKRICNAEKEIEKEIEKDKDNTPSPKVKKHKFGQYQHVLLSDTQLLNLKEEYPSKWLDLITYLDEYIEMKGYKAKNHYLAIKKWVVDAVERENREKSQKLPDFTLQRKEKKLSEEDRELLRRLDS